MKARHAQMLRLLLPASLIVMLLAAGIFIYYYETQNDAQEQTRTQKVDRTLQSQLQQAEPRQEAENGDVETTEDEAKEATPAPAPEVKPLLEVKNEVNVIAQQEEVVAVKTDRGIVYKSKATAETQQPVATATISPVQTKALKLDELKPVRDDAPATAGTSTKAPTGISYNLDPYQDTLVHTAGGAMLFIPANSFVKADGAIVGVRVVMSVNEQPGSISLKVMDDKTPLLLKPGRTLYLEMATGQGRNIKSMTPMTLVALEAGQQSPQATEPLMLRIPLEKMNLEQMAATRPEKVRKAIAALNTPDLANSWIATREFAERLYYLMWLEDDFELLLELYTQNTHQPLHIADDIVARRIEALKIARGQEHMVLYTKAEERFSYFAAQGRTTLLPTEVAGVQLASPKAGFQLLRTGMSDAAAHRYLTLHRTQQRLQRMPAQVLQTQAELSRNAYQLAQTGSLQLVPDATPAPLPQSPAAEDMAASVATTR